MKTNVKLMFFCLFACCLFAVNSREVNSFAQAYSASILAGIKMYNNIFPPALT